MSADWKITTLREAGIALIDCDHKTPSAQPEGLPYVGIPQIKDGRVTLNGVRLISSSDFDHWRRKAKPSTNDVILSRRCNPGEAAYVPSGLEIALGQNLVLLRSDGVRVYPPFLRWLTRGPNWWEQVNKFINVGAVFNSLKCADIPNFEILLPPFEAQIKISKVLEDLDRKIELNTQTNQTLESIAQAIFKSWFVDFEPVKAKMAAKERWYAMQPTSESASPVCYADDDALPDLETYTNLAAMCAISGKSETELAQLQQQNPNQYHQLAETAALFPSTMVGSELGEIPEGWEVCKFQEIANIIMGQSPAGDTYNSEANGIPLINGPVEFGDYYPERTKWTTSPTKLSAKGDLVVCVRGSTTGRFVKSDGQYCLGRGVCAIRGKRHQCFVDLSFKYNIEALLHLATGSTFPNWSSLTLSSFSITCPTDPIIIIFEEQIKALTAKLENGVVENHYLSQLRDSLVPKLLSGEIDLTKTESEIT